MVNLKISGIIIFALTLILFFLSFNTFFSFLNPTNSDDFTNFDEIGESYNKIQKTNTIFSIIISLLSIVFFLGFVTLGKMFDNKLLKVTAWIFIVVAVLGFVFTSIDLATTDFNSNSIEMDLTQNSGIIGMAESKIKTIPVFGSLLDILGMAMLLPLIILLGLGVLAVQVCFGIGLIQVGKKKSRLAEWAGAFEIGSIILGFLGTIAVLFESIIFFKLSKEQENLQQYPPAQPRQIPPQGYQQPPHPQ
jgi:hypothetical protein